MMKNALFPAGLFIAAAALTGCLFGNSSGDPANPGEATQTIPYKVEGNTIITSDYVIPDTRCDGDVLQAEPDTIEGSTVTFQITGSTLTIFADKDTLESGAVTERVVVFTREGSGTGLGGLWSNTSQDLRVISGTLSEAEENRLEEDKKFTASYRAYMRSWVRFADGKIFSYQDREYAKQFLSDWNDEFATMPNADSARFAVTVKTVDKYTVELKGRMNGETVRLTQNFDGTTYSSDTPGHASHRYLSDPETCPNEFTPEWYDEFLQANRNPVVLEGGFGLEKTAEIHPKTGNPRHFPFGPLKTVYSLLN